MKLSGNKRLQKKLLLKTQMIKMKNQIIPLFTINRNAGCEYINIQKLFCWQCFKNKI